MAPGVSDAFLESVPGALRGGELCFGLQTVTLRGVHAGFGFGDFGSKLRRLNLRGVGLV